MSNSLEHDSGSPRPASKRGEGSFNLDGVHAAKRGEGSKSKVLRDSWLAPLSLDANILAQDPQINSDGLRARDKGFLNIGWSEYVEPLGWTARQRVSEFVESCLKVSVSC